MRIYFERSLKGRWQAKMQKSSENNRKVTEYYSLVVGIKGVVT